MPSPSELAWIEKSDFSGGLWARESERECPQNGLLEATDCYPQARGGLRAFMRMEPVSQTGLANNMVVLGLWKLRPPFPQGRLRLAGLEIDAGGAGLHTLNYYSMQVGGNPASTVRTEIATGTWNLDAAHVNVSVIDPSLDMVAYRDGDVGYRVWYNAPVAQGAGGTDYTTQGIYRMGSSVSSSTVSSGTTRLIVSTQNIPTGAANVPLWPVALASHQARLVNAATFNQLHNRMYMTSQGGTTGTTDFLDPLGEKSGSLNFLEPSQSDYLVVGKSQTGVLVVQGDLLNPISRQLSFSNNNMQSFACATEQGVIFMVQGDAMYIATQSGVQNITPNFYGTPMNPGLDPATYSVANSDVIKLSRPTVAGNFLFAGNGYVMDMRTNAWFTSSFTPASKHHATDNSFYGIFTSENALTGTGQVLHHGYFLENQDATADTWNPCHTYTFTTPITYNPHQQTQVREIVYHVETFTPGSTIRVEVSTEAGTVFEETYECASVGSQPVRASGIRADGDWVKVRTTISADPKQPAPNEAPLLERMLIGTQPNTRTKQAAIR